MLTIPILDIVTGFVGAASLGMGIHAQISPKKGCLEVLCFLRIAYTFQADSKSYRCKSIWHQQDQL